jgi:hypothetical protein
MTAAAAYSVLASALRRSGLSHIATRFQVSSFELSDMR